MVANVIGVKPPTVGGTGSVVETVAQNWTPLVREVQHECADSHQGTSTLLGRTCGQNPLLGGLRERLEMSGTSVVEMTTALLERSRERQVGRTTSKTIQNLQMGRYSVDRGIQSLWECSLQHLYKTRQDLYRIVCSGGSSGKLEHIDLNMTVLNFSVTAPAATGFEWRRMVASMGGHKRR